MSDTADLKRRIRALEAALLAHGAHDRACPFDAFGAAALGGCTCPTLAALRPRFLDKVVVKENE